MGERYDVFICHASEDKGRIVAPLVAALQALELRVWYDAFEIDIGDDFRRRMNEGLLASRYGVVVLSQRFFKYWTQQELSALFTLEAGGDEVRILPIRCDLSFEELRARDPMLASRHAYEWADGIRSIAQRLADRVRDTTPPRGDRRSPVFNLPSGRAQTIFGREAELARLDELLRPGASISIEALAGVGKTELALHAALRAAATGRFPGGIFWLDADNADLTATWAGPIAARLPTGDSSPAERTNAVLRIISSGGPALIVLDNVTSWTKQGAPHPLPEGTHLTWLVTTRERTIGGQRFEHVPLSCLDPGPSRAFLVSIAGRPLVCEPGLDELLARLDGHALALELAGAFLREYPATSPSAYLAMLQTGRDPEEKVRNEVRSDQTVRDAFAATWARLDEPARQGLMVAGWFAYEEASIELLTECGVDEDAQRVLRRFHLITCHERRWNMHRLVHDYARGRGDAASQAQAQRRFVDGCSAFSNNLIRQDAGYRSYIADRPHFEQAIGLRAVLADEPAVLAGLLHRVGVGARSAGDLQRARAHFGEALAIILDRYGEEDELIAPFRAHLASVLQELGELTRAHELLVQVLARYERDGNVHLIAHTRAGLAKVLQDLGRLSDAAATMRKAVEDHVAAFGEDHHAVATYRHGFADILHDQGDYSAARDLLERAIASGRKTLPEYHPAIADRLSSLARVMRGLGDLRGACRFGEEALRCAHAYLRGHERHPALAKFRSSYANSLAALGEFHRARDLLELALADSVNALGDGHLRVALARTSLGNVYTQLGELHRARDLVEQAMRSAPTNGEGEHHWLIGVAPTLAAVYRELGDLERARELLERLLEFDVTRHPGHPRIAQTRADLAAGLYEEGNLTRAREQLELALSATRSFADDNPFIASLRTRLARVKEAQGDLPGARELLESALAADLRGSLPDHPVVMQRRAQLATVLRALGDDAARGLLDEALAADAAAFTADDLPSLSRRFTAATMCVEAGDLERARPLLVQVLASNELLRGPQSAITAVTRATLAQLDHRLGDTDAARAAMMRAIADVAADPPGSKYRREVDKLSAAMG